MPHHYDSDWDYQDRFQPKRRPLNEEEPDDYED